MNTRIRHTFIKPELLSPAWTLHKEERHAHCEIWSHILGFELRLTVNDDPLPRTQVCKSQKDLIATQDGWRAALEAKGWTRE